MKVFSNFREETIFNNLKGDGTILVVDDSKMVRDVTSKMISFLGYTVHTAESGEIAIIWLQKHDADLLVLEMDLGLGIDGCQTYEKALEIRQNQKAIVASGLAEEKAMKKALHLGVKSFLFKPYSIEDLGSVIQRAMKS